MDVLFLVHLLEVVALCDGDKVALGLFGLLVGAAGLLLDLDLLLRGLLDTLLELFKLVLLLDDELVDRVVLEPQFAQSVGDLLLLLIARFLRRKLRKQGIPRRE